MDTVPTYQVAFKFQFRQDFASQAVQINIVDSNNFVIANGEKVQLQPYLGSTTPPLSNFSVSDQEIFLNIGSGQEDEGMQGIVWATFSNGGDGQTLAINLQAATGLINTSYMVMGTSVSGALVAGKNVISINS